MTVRVLFVASEDPRTAAAFSGTPHFLFSAFERVADVELLPVRNSVVLRGLGRAASLLRRRQVALGRSALQLWMWRVLVERRLRRSHYDLVFAPASSPIAAVRTTLPVAYWIDAVYHQLTELSPPPVRPSAGTLARGDRQEQRALRTADLGAYSSTWAAEGAWQLVPEARLVVLDYGPNLSPDSVARIREARTQRADSGRPLTLLWIGKDWARKGGDRVLAAAALLAEGRSVHVDLVGDTPASVPGLATAHGSLNKDTREGLAALEALWAQADVFVLPTLADCTPIVLSEAAAIGVPVVATDVGGVGDLVRRRCAGHALALDASDDEWAATIDSAAGLQEHAASLPAPSYEESLARLLAELGLR